MLPNLKIALPTAPASTSAPIITTNSIGSEPGCFSDDDPAAKVTAATAGGGAASEFDCPASSELLVVGAGLADELTPDGSGQREAMTDRALVPSPPFPACPSSTPPPLPVYARP